MPLLSNEVMSSGFLGAVINQGYFPVLVPVGIVGNLLSFLVSFLAQFPPNFIWCNIVLVNKNLHGLFKMTKVSNKQNVYFR